MGSTPTRGSKNKDDMESIKSVLEKEHQIQPALLDDPLFVDKLASSWEKNVLRQILGKFDADANSKDPQERRAGQWTVSMYPFTMSVHSCDFCGIGIQHKDLVVYVPGLGVNTNAHLLCLVSHLVYLGGIANSQENEQQALTVQRLRDEFKAVPVTGYRKK